MSGQLFVVQDVCKLQDPQLQVKVEEAIRGLVSVMCNPEGVVVLNVPDADRKVMQASIDTLAGFVGMGCGNETAR